MREIELDIRAANDPRELHGLIRRAFAFADAYGANLDALHDLLTAVCGECRVRVLYRPDQPQPFCNYQNKALRVLRDAQDENPSLRLEFLPET